MSNDRNRNNHSRDRDIQARTRCGDRPERHGIPSDQTRSWSADQIARKQPHGLVREAEVRAVDEDNRKVELSFSSETPVPRFFGDEVLSHETGAMRRDRLDRAAPLLMNHDWDDQIGVIESAEVRERKGYATVRFSKSQRGEEMWQDVIDGIRRNVSVGYAIHGVNVQERDGQPDLVTVTDWEPMEISLAPVAADVSVGVGRKHQPENSPEAPSSDDLDTGNRENHFAQRNQEGHADMKTKILRNEQGDLVRAKVDEQGQIVETLEVIERAGEAENHAKRQGQQAGEAAGRETEQARTKELIEMGAAYDARDLAQTAVAEGTSVDAFQRQLLDHINGKSKRSGKREPKLGDQGASIGMSDNDVRQYSFMKAVRALSNPGDTRAQEEAAFEFEASRAAAERTGRQPKGLLVPEDVLNRAITGVNVTTGSEGGDLVATDLLTSSFVELLRNRAIVLQHARTLNGLVGNVDIPKQISGSQGYWLTAEDDDATETEPAFGLISLTPNTVGAYSEITRKMLQQSSLGIEALVRSDLAKALALTIDKAAFYGSGATGEPKGIVNMSGVNAVDFSTDKKPTYAEIVEMESQIAADNADVNSMIYMLNSAMRGTLKTTEKFSGTNGAPVWEPGDTVNGYTTGVTNQISDTDVIFGNFADLLVGMWGGLDLTVDPYSNSKSGKLRVVAFQDVDIAARHEASFCLGQHVV